jgi:hypothetical protein
MYIPRNWEFGQAFSKLRNFGGFEPPQTPPWVRQCLEIDVLAGLQEKLL